MGAVIVMEFYESGHCEVNMVGTLERRGGSAVQTGEQGECDDGEHLKSTMTMVVRKERP